MDDVNERVSVNETKIRSLEKRMSKVEEIAESTNKLALSIEKLAFVQENMIKEQQAQRKDIDEIKTQPSKDAHALKMKVLETILTGVAGALVGAILALIIKGGTL